MGLQLSEFRAAGYRSLRDIRFPAGPLGVFVGANGAGKTNLYRALQLLQAAAEGTLARELAAEGGMDRAYTAAGPKRKNERPRIVLGARFASGDAALAFDYAVEIGFRLPFAAAFRSEPQVKEEMLTVRHRGRTRKLLERRGPETLARDRDDAMAALGTALLASETALGALDDPGRFPDLWTIRRTMLDWRFYHEMRTDRDAALRRPCLAVASPTLASDGANLAAVLATLVWIREDRAELDRAIEDAFPGAALDIPEPGDTAAFAMRFPEFPDRAFAAAELSDGTLRYLALVGALLAYRLPAFIALNEPETSLHPDLLAPLARLIVEASRRTQIWLVTHSERLADAIAEAGAVKPMRVVKRDGNSWIEGLTLMGEFRGDEEETGR